MKIFFSLLLFYFAVVFGVSAHAAETMPGRAFAMQMIQNAITRYEAIEAQGGFTDLSKLPNLKIGATHALVPQLRYRLMQEGFLSYNEAEMRDTTYDAALAQGIQLFQDAHGLTPTGELTKATRETLHISPRDKADVLRINLARWAELPEDLGKRYVLVNIPSAELKLRDGLTTQWTARVVVGRKQRPTPTLSSAINTYIVNPQWNPPPTIIKEDIIPGMRRDPDYLLKKGIKIRMRGDEEGDEYGRDIDWEEESPRGFRFYQEAGARNSLGQLKLDFDNAYAVYIHGTPDKRLFARTQRFESSGCIRVKEPEVLAALLANGAATTVDSEAILRRIRSGATQHVKLPEPVPVHITYFTAYVDEQGYVNFRRDIYERDKPQLDALRADKKKAAEAALAQHQLAAR